MFKFRSVSNIVLASPNTGKDNNRRMVVIKTGQANKRVGERKEKELEGGRDRDAQRKRESESERKGKREVEFQREKEMVRGREKGRERWNSKVRGKRE